MNRKIIFKSSLFLLCAFTAVDTTAQENTTDTKETKES